MRKVMIVVFLYLMCTGYAACSTVDNGSTQKVTIAQDDSSKSSSYTNIRPEEAKKCLESEKGIILLDVRTQEEYDEKHIPNSLLIPVDVIEKEAAVQLADKNTTIFVYLGGIIDWPYETENGK